MNNDCIVYRIINSQTGRIYIGSSSQYAKRKATHLNEIRNKTHENPKIRFDSAWCSENAWSIKVIREFSSAQEMHEFEEKLIRMYFGRPCSYNVSLAAIRQKTNNYVALWRAKDWPKIYGSLHAMARGERIKKSKIIELSAGVYLVENNVAINPSLLENNVVLTSEFPQKNHTQQLKELLKVANGKPNGITHDGLQYENFKISQQEAAILRLLCAAPAKKSRVIDEIVDRSVHLREDPKLTIKSCIKNDLIIDKSGLLIATEKGARILEFLEEASNRAEVRKSSRIAQKMPTVLSNTCAHDENLTKLCLSRDGAILEHPSLTKEVRKIIQVAYENEPTHLIVATNTANAITIDIAAAHSIEKLNASIAKELDGGEMVVSFCLVRSSDAEERQLCVISKLGAGFALPLVNFLKLGKIKLLQLSPKDSLLKINNSITFETHLFITSKGRCYQFPASNYPISKLGGKGSATSGMDKDEFLAQCCSTSPIASRCMVIFRCGKAISLANSWEYNRYFSRPGLTLLADDDVRVEAIIPYHFATHSYAIISLRLSDGAEYNINCADVNKFRGELVPVTSILENWNSESEILDYELQSLNIAEEHDE